MKWRQFKCTLYVLAVVFVFGVAAFGGTDVNAATIKSEPTENTKQTVEVGDRYSVGSVTNFKINGKKYSKLKKKVKTVQTWYSPNYIKNEANKTEYVDNEFVSDTEDYKQQKEENYKYISVGDYEFTFLKPGTYKISYDKYVKGETKKTPSADGKSTTTTYELIKTHYVDTYRVVTTTDPIKSITLGKNKITNTYKSSGTKTNVKTVTKFRYLKGKSGKLSFKTNKNYKITSAYVVTYNANGEVIVTPSGNNKKVTYGTGKINSKTEKEQYILDANGNYTYVKDAAGKDTNVRQSQMVTIATSTSKYKPTEIHYGYQDTFTGSYTKYSVSKRQVYVPRKDEKKHRLYEKNPDGTIVQEEVTYWYEKYDGTYTCFTGKRDKPVVDLVTATVITMTYPQRTIVDGAYATVTVVAEKIILPGAKSTDERDTYYMDARCLGDSYESGVFKIISKAGVNYYDTVTLENGAVKKYENPKYYRKFYQADYQGSWQPVADGNYSSKACDRTINPKTGETVTTTKYRWVDTYDAQGNRKRIKDYNKVKTTSLNSSITFNMK